MQINNGKMQTPAETAKYKKIRKRYEYVRRKVPTLNNPVLEDLLKELLLHDLSLNERLLNAETILHGVNRSGKQFIQKPLDEADAFDDLEL